MGEMGGNAACCSVCSGSSVAGTDTKDPNSTDEVENFLECLDDCGFVVEAAPAVPNIGIGRGEAGGVGGEKRVANKFSVPSCSFCRGWARSDSG